MIFDLTLGLGRLAESIATVDNFLQSRMAASNCAERNLAFLSRLKSRFPARTFYDRYTEITLLYTRAPRLTILDCLEHRSQGGGPGSVRCAAAGSPLLLLERRQRPWARLEYRGW